MLQQYTMKDKLIAAIDKALEEGRWESSLFFKNIRKQLQKLRDFVKQELADDQSVNSLEDAMNLLEIERRKAGYELVYIAIYQTDGEFLEKWVNPIKTLTGHSVSRPVYQAEEHVSELIRAKRSRNDAYIAVWVKPTDIMNRQNVVKDRLGHPVLTLKDGSVKLENIVEFIHDNRRFMFKENELVVKGR
jgi:intracellular multiplication protein IcmQ